MRRSVPTPHTPASYPGSRACTYPACTRTLPDSRARTCARAYPVDTNPDSRARARTCPSARTRLVDTRTCPAACTYPDSRASTRARTRNPFAFPGPRVETGLHAPA